MWRGQVLGSLGCRPSSLLGGFGVWDRQWAGSRSPDHVICLATANSLILLDVCRPGSDWQGDVSVGRESWPLASWQQALGYHVERRLEAVRIIRQPRLG